MRKQCARHIGLITMIVLIAVWLLAEIGWSESPIEDRIIMAPHEVLRQNAADIHPGDQETIELLQDMAEYLDDSLLVKGGLSLPQVAVSKRGFVAMLDDEPVIMINPVVKLNGNDTPSLEGCLSIPRTFGYVNRSSSVIVEYYDADWNWQKVRFSDLEAFIIQHENDHLDGILFTDKLLAEAPVRNRSELPLE